MIQELLDYAKKLSPERLEVLVELAFALGRDIEVHVLSSNSLVTPSFVEDFSARLIAYHSFHEQKLTKKGFEYLFKGANLAENRNASIVTNPVNSGTVQQPKTLLER